MSYYELPLSYFKSPNVADPDEVHAPVPGWGQWLTDVGYRPRQVGVGWFGDATTPVPTDPTAPPATPTATAASSMGTYLAVGGGALAVGVLLGYLLAKGH